MTAAPHPDAGQLFVVDVCEQINTTLAGHDGCRYASPPQSHADALALVTLLLGCPAETAAGQDRWTRPVAGGQRTIALRPVA